MTFTLTGFSTVKREGIELTGSFIAHDQRRHEGRRRRGDDHRHRRDADRRRAERPAPDHAQQRDADDGADGAVVGGDGRADSRHRTIQAGTSADIQVTPQMTVFGGAGGRSNEGRMQVDGLDTGAALNGGGVSTYVADISNAQEVVTTTSGGLGEAEVGGPTLSIVPKSGGNTVKGAGLPLRRQQRHGRQQLHATLKAAGLATPGELLKQWDYTVGVGGPIKKDRLWYYGTLRDEGQHRSIPGIYPEPERRRSDQVHLRAGHDASRRRAPRASSSSSIRLTAQVTPRNKFNFHWDVQRPCNGASFTPSGDACRTQPDSDAFVGSLGLGGLTATTSPETARLPAHAGARTPGHVVVAGDQPAAARSGRRHVSRGVGSVRSAGQPDARPRAHHRAWRRCNGAVAGLQRTARPTGRRTGTTRTRGARRRRT